MERSQSVEVCTVCHEHMDILAIGACNHPICYRCSSRMRILCEQMYCPICRGHLQKVLFVKHYDKFEKINIENFKRETKSIYLESEDVEKAFKQLLTIQCKKCPNRPSDKTIDGLRDHLRKEHTLFLCDLCLNHLNIFPFERKFYNRKDLATHRRVGDADDKSYKGHPLCVFCDERYMDNDELLRHLRKDHYFCHICDADGSNDYYNDYPDLKTHFRDSHYLCEEEDCGNPTTQFTNAFRNSIELKAHKASHHTKGMSKSQIREASRLDIEIQLPPRRQGRDRGRITGRDYEEVHETNNNGGGARGRGGYNGPGSSRGRGHRKPDMYQENQEELERAIEASKRDAPGVKKMSWSAEDIRQDFPALSSQETTSTTASTPTTTDAVTATTSTAVNNTNSAPTTSMAARISNDKVDDSSKAFPQLKKNSAKNNTKSEKSGRNSPNVKDKKNTGRTSPVARVMQPVPTSKKVKEEDFPDLSSSKNRNSNLIKLGAWTQNSQRTDLVRPNIPVEPQKTNYFVPKPRPQSASNSLASVGMSLCAPSSSITKTKEPKSSSGAKSVNISDFPTLNTKPMETLNMISQSSFSALNSKPAESSKTIPNTNSSKPVNTKSQKDFPSLGGGKPPQSVTNNNLSWGQKKKKKQTKVPHDDDFEIPPAALENPPPVSEIKKESEPKPGNDQNTKNKKKKKKKNKEMGENSESNVENESPSVSPDSSVSEKQKQSKDAPKKQNGVKKDKGPAATLDGIAMELLNEEKDRPVTKSSKHKDTSKMLPKKTKETVSVDSAQTTSSSSSSSSLKDPPVLVPNFLATTLPVQNISSLNDFPSLSASVKSPPPGFQKSGKKPPPGFSSTGPSRPPPGFSKTEDQIPESTPDAVVKSSHTYIQPAEFQQRNQALVKKVKEALSESENFDEFKTKSWQFRQNEIMASEYYYGCEKLLGKEKFGEIFSELLILLPDIKKQQDLLSVHQQSLKKLGNNNVLRISGKSQKAPWSAFNDFQVCPTCNQVLLHKDITAHAENHSVGDYPALGRAKAANDFINRGSWVAAK